MVLAAKLAMSLVSPPVAALDPDRLPSQFQRTVWRAPAIPHDSVSVLLEDRDGYLWVGTVEGLARFDGIRSEVFHPDHTSGLRHPWIRDLAEDAEGRIWIGTLGGGLSVWQDGSVHAVPELPAQLVHRLALDPAGRLHVATNRGVWRRSGSGFEPLPGAEALAESLIVTFGFDDAGDLLIHAEDRLYVWRSGRLEALLPEGTRIQVGTRGMVRGEEGLWLFGEKAWLYRAGRLEERELGTGELNRRVWSAARDREGALWLGTDGDGLLRLHRGKSAVLRERREPEMDYVWSLLLDRRGQLWVGTNGGGLRVLRDSAVLPWGESEGMADAFVRALLETSDGTVYLGTQLGGLYALKDGGLRRVPAPILEGSSVLALESGSGGELWIGSGIGLHRLRDGELEAQPLPGLGRFNVGALRRTRDGTLWILAWNGGLRAVREGRMVELPPALRAVRAGLSALFEASDGALWIATQHGAYRWDGAKLSRYGVEHGLPTEAVASFAEGPPGTVWIATGRGLVRWRDERIDVLSRADGLLDGRIKTLVVDGESQLWLGSYRGLQRLPLAAAEARLAGSTAGLPVAQIGLAEGLRHLEINGGGQTAVLGRDGRLLFATRAGLVVIDPRFAPPPRGPIPLRIEAVEVDGQQAAPAALHALGAGPRNLGFRFAALDPARARELVIEQRLEPIDREWQPVGERRIAEYPRLAAGDYRFRLRVRDPEGESGFSELSLGFRIARHWSSTPWAYGGYAVAAAFAFLLALRWRLRALQARQRELERLVGERTAEVKAANQRLLQLSREDALTGVGNRRRLDETLTEEWARAARHDRPLSLVLVDVDRFKAFNDLLGHPAGDQCLRRVGELLAGLHARAGETVARYGGEEFAILLPDYEKGDAIRAAERIRAMVAALRIPHPESGRSVTVSAGVATARPARGGQPSDLVAEADRALYRAKAEGRDRVAAA